MADQEFQTSATEQELTSLSEAACSYLERGWSVIPLRGKLPLFSWKDFQTRRATANEVASWFADDRRVPTGVAVVTGLLSGVVVVDCDTTSDAAFWRATFPSSPLIVETGGGGVHLYYAMPALGQVRNRAGVLGRKIDVRGEGGYAVAPPSWHPNGGRYVWQGFDASATLPSFDSNWLIDRSKTASLPTIEQTTHVRNAVAYLRRIQAVAGEGGHNATFRAACKLRDAGLSRDEALAVLSDWNETNANPPWSAQELAHKIKSAYRSIS